MSEFGLGHYTFNGRNGSGSVSVPGLKAGDICLQQVVNGTYIPPDGSEFERVISTDGQIVQNDAANLSAISCQVIVVRGL